MTEANQSYDGSIDPYYPLDMWDLMSKLLIFDIDYVYLWRQLWLPLTLIIFISNVKYDYFWCLLHLSYLLVYTRYWLNFTSKSQLRIPKICFRQHILFLIELGFLWYFLHTFNFVHRMQYFIFRAYLTAVYFSASSQNCAYMLISRTEALTISIIDK